MMTRNEQFKSQIILLELAFIILLLIVIFG